MGETRYLTDDAIEVLKPIMEKRNDSVSDAVLYLNDNKRQLEKILDNDEVSGRVKQRCLREIHGVDHIEVFL